MKFKELLSFLLSFLSIFVLISLFILDSDTELYKLLNYYDLLFCGYFFYEFVITLKNSENKWQYLYRFGWIDFLSTIPSIGIFRIGRFIKFFRLIRIIKSLKVIKTSITSFNVYNKFTIVYLLVFLISPILILLAEQNDINSNIKTAENSIWWTYITITTVGYGDFYPVTSMGKIVASILILFGISLFGIVTTYFTSKMKL